MLDSLRRASSAEITPKGAKSGPNLTDWLEDRVGRKADPGSVLFHASAPAFQSPGGGEVQLVETARALEELGVCVRPFVPWVDRLADARLVHLFGMSREGLTLAEAAKSRGLPVVLSPICWVEPSAFSVLHSSRVKVAKAWGGWLARKAWPRGPHWRRSLLLAADAVLPNSQREAHQLARLYGIGFERFCVVPNGVDARFEWADPGLFEQRFGVREFLLFTGRIEPRKNVLALVEAARRLDRSLVIIGDVVPGHESYAEKCRARGQVFTHWIPRLEPNDPALSSAYAAAHTFVLPSWFETPGLSALEAALAGCRVVITSRGCTREYFGDLASYADPGSVDSISEAIRRAANQRQQPDLAAHVKSRYLWSDVARRTVEVYDDLRR